MLVYDWMWWGHLTNQKAGCMEGCTEGCVEGCTEGCAEGCTEGCVEGCTEVVAPGNHKFSELLIVSEH